MTSRPPPGDRNPRPQRRLLHSPNLAPEQQGFGFISEDTRPDFNDRLSRNMRLITEQPHASNENNSQSGETSQFSDPELQDMPLDFSTKKNSIKHENDSHLVDCSPDGHNVVEEGSSPKAFSPHSPDNAHQPREMLFSPVSDDGNASIDLRMPGLLRASNHQDPREFASGSSSSVGMFQPRLPTSHSFPLHPAMNPITFPSSLRPMALPDVTSSMSQMSLLPVSVCSNFQMPQTSGTGRGEKRPFTAYFEMCDQRGSFNFPSRGLNGFGSVRSPDSSGVAHQNNNNTVNGSSNELQNNSDHHSTKIERDTEHNTSNASDNSIHDAETVETSRKRRTVPDSQKDEAYKRKREKNNKAAKKSRDARRMKEDRLAIECIALKATNDRLTYENELHRIRITDLSQELDDTKRQIFQLISENIMLRQQRAQM